MLWKLHQRTNTPRRDILHPVQEASTPHGTPSMTPRHTPRTPRTTRDIDVIPPAGETSYKGSTRKSDSPASDAGYSSSPVSKENKCVCHYSNAC